MLLGVASAEAGVLSIVVAAVMVEDVEVGSDELSVETMAPSPLSTIPRSSEQQEGSLSQQKLPSLHLTARGKNPVPGSVVHDQHEDMKVAEQEATHHIDKCWHSRPRGKRSTQEQHIGHPGHRICSDHKDLLSGSRCATQNTAYCWRISDRSSCSSRSCQEGCHPGLERVQGKDRGEQQQQQQYECSATSSWVVLGSRKSTIEANCWCGSEMQSWTPYRRKKEANRTGLKPLKA